MARSSSSSFVSTPPASLYIVPVLPGLHRLPAVLFLPGQEIPLDRIPANRRRFHSSSSPSPCKWFMVSPHSSSSDLLSSSSSDGPSHKRGKSPTTCWQHLCHPFELIFYLPYKRLRDSPSRHHHETRIEDSTETSYEASVKDYIGIGIESGTEANIEATAEVVAKPDLPLILPEQMMAERLDNHKEVIQERYD
ncbi:hypothetical protein Tco_0248880, partial [Tanacetum coccineum]